MKPVLVRPILSLVLSVILSLGALSLEAQAQAAGTSAYRACLRGALTPVTATSAYRNGSVREKRALLNSYKAEVSRNRAACKAQGYASGLSLRVKP
ncbi:hypothetical protein PQU92_15925 [Asticcacaulis sp. BYS171W]|uniref:UrcA family protein n=1 Tax=Asticcacaulis aquaticus TaxID=2984212 RepID=A0ABT5HXU5_9CAUL|nr:hypothetical protein [Asticcacaulis aquaticus]MDC7684773.1 hypothetical protein [Asticcacaulis aquaticus]